MARGDGATRPWLLGNAWGRYSSTAELPNTSGATVQNSALEIGDFAVVGSTEYQCTTATPSAAVWAAVMRADSATALTAGRVPYVATGGVLTSESGLEYDASGNVLTAPAVVVTDITATHVPYAGTAGRLKGEAAFAYTEGSDLLTVTNATVTTALTNTALTATRVPYVGAAGLIKDKSTMTFTEGSDTLSVTNVTATAVLAASAAATVGTTLGVTGASTLSGGIVAPAPSYIGTIPLGSVAYASLGTDAAHVAGTLYVAEITVPSNKSLTGFEVLQGATAAGTDKLIAGLYNEAGTTKLAWSDLAGTATNGANTLLALAFLTPYSAVGPARYWIVIQCNGTTDGTRRVAASTYRLLSKEISGGAFGTLPDTITPPTTFAADKAPIGNLY